MSVVSLTTLLPAPVVSRMSPDEAVKARGYLARAEHARRIRAMLMLAEVGVNDLLHGDVQPLGSDEEQSQLDDEIESAGAALDELAERLAAYADLCDAFASNAANIAFRSYCAAG